jgi:hypothetical protein
VVVIGKAKHQGFLYDHRAALCSTSQRRLYVVFGAVITPRALCSPGLYHQLLQRHGLLGWEWVRMYLAWCSYNPLAYPPGCAAFIS